MISVVVRTFNEEKYLEKLLIGINQQLIDDEVEIIIVDSGSSDRTLNIANNFDCRILKIAKEDFTFGRSLNYGCQKANGEFLVFISAHCIPYNNEWLSSLLTPFEDDEVALCYGRQVGYETTKFSEHQVFSKYFPKQKKNEQGGFFCNNANSAIRRELWLRRNFNEELTGLEDMDWAKHFFAQKKKIVYCPDSTIYHVHEESWRKVKLRYERESYALKEIMPEIHFSFLDFLKAVIKGVINDIQVSLKRGVFWTSVKSILMFRICQFYGAYKGNHIHRKLSREKKENYFYP